MGTRGPAPIPKEILRARGSWRGKETSTSPMVVRMTPDKPPFLIGEAGLVWDRMVHVLERMGVLAESDREFLIRYCLLSARYYQVEMYLMRKGMHTYPIKNKDDKIIGVKMYPEAIVANHLAKLLNRMDAEFGLTPSSRGTVNKVVDAASDKQLDMAEEEDEESLFRDDA